MEKVIYCIGKTENVQLFNGVGIESLTITDQLTLKETIDELAEKGAKIIIVSESLKVELKETLQKYQEKTFPIILILPIDEASTGEGVKKIQHDVEKAIGINIF